MDTIFAEATPAGRGGVSVVRISGPDAHALLAALAGALPPARRAVRAALRDGAEPLDDALVLRFDAGASFTGEDVAELHLHGAPVVVARIGTALRARGARPAMPGEFSRRALANGRLDLTEIEGLGDLLAAETESQRRQALRAAQGGLRALAAGWRARLVDAGAALAAEIDFPDEDVPDARDPRLAGWLAEVRNGIAAELASAGRAQQLRRGFEVAIVGAPNAGKSSLINAIARRTVALVSDVAGTTRDVVEFRCDLGGMAVTFLDTAGLRETADRIEAMGVALARERADAADLRILLDDGSGADVALRPGDVTLRAKGDLIGAPEGSVSGTTGVGVAELLERVAQTLRARVGEGGLVAHARQAAALERARAALDTDPQAPAEVLAEAIRDAAQALEVLVGRVDVEDYLDAVFARFCIGK